MATALRQTNFQILSRKMLDVRYYSSRRENLGSRWSRALSRVPSVPRTDFLWDSQRSSNSKHFDFPLEFGMQHGSRSTTCSRNTHTELKYSHKASASMISFPNLLARSQITPSPISRIAGGISCPIARPRSNQCNCGKGKWTNAAGVYTSNRS